MPTTPDLPGLFVVRHPLVQHKLSLLRDRATPTKIFKELVDEIAMLMAYEATANLSLEPCEVETPLERMTGARVAGKKLVLVPILRAGLGMVEGILRLMPSARVGHVGLYRDHDTLQPVDYYLKKAGAVRIRFLCLVAAPVGVQRLRAAHPDVPIIAASLDRELNASGYILPGLGDAGDRLFGTR
jgi:uracil phosphoribosyltransferase